MRTNPQAHLQINLSIAYSHPSAHTHSPAVSLIDRLQERNIYKHTHTSTHTLSKHFPKACGRETFTSIRFQPGPQPTLQQKCAYSISIHTHARTHTHNLTLSSCLSHNTLPLVSFSSLRTHSCKWKYAARNVIISSCRYDNKTKE